MAENSKFCGSGGYFWPRRLNRLLKLIGMVYPIYPDDFNVKGFDLWGSWSMGCVWPENIFCNI
jgi:hypothetical protein